MIVVTCGDIKPKQQDMALPYATKLEGAVLATTTCDDFILFLAYFPSSGSVPPLFFSNKQIKYHVHLL